MGSLSDQPASPEEISPEIDDPAHSSPSYYHFGGNVYYAEGL